VIHRIKLIIFLTINYCVLFILVKYLKKKERLARGPQWIITCISQKKNDFIRCISSLNLKSFKNVSLLYFICFIIVSN